MIPDGNYLTIQNLTIDCDKLSYAYLFMNPASTGEFFRAFLTHLSLSALHLFLGSTAYRAALRQIRATGLKRGVTLLRAKADVGVASYGEEAQAKDTLRCREPVARSVFA